MGVNSDVQPTGPVKDRSLRRWRRLPGETKPLKRTTLAVCLVWLMLIAGSLMWNLWHARLEQQAIVLQTAKTILSHALELHTAAMRHNRDMLAALPATGAGPAGDGATSPAWPSPSAGNGIPQRQLSLLDPAMPILEPADSEHQPLAKLFDGGLELSRMANGTFHYLAPLRMERDCMECHEPGHVLGGAMPAAVSIALPYTREIPALSLTFGHSLIGLFGLMGILMYGRKLEKAYEAIRRQSNIDELTGIPNRRSLDTHLSLEFDQCRRYDNCLTLIMCDIDHFKAYNDTYGHKAGDECLRRVASAIQGVLNRPRDFCGRYGGEEFVIVLSDTTVDGGLHVAEKVRQKVLDLGIMHRNGTATKQVTISLGVATDKARSLSSYVTLLERADRAMYAAKSGGRNQLRVFGPPDDPTSPAPNPCAHGTSGHAG